MLDPVSSLQTFDPHLAPTTAAVTSAVVAARQKQWPTHPAVAPDYVLVDPPRSARFLRHRHGTDQPVANRDTGATDAMFERNRVDNTPEHAAVAIEATLDDGRILKGKVAIPLSKTVYDALNGNSLFLDFEPFEGDRQFIAKSSLRAVKLLSVGKPPNFSARLRDMDGFDPLTILGLPRGAGWEDVRSAYHRLAKTYHPDRYENADLPPEVRDYLAQMVRRINAAYAALEAPQQATKLAAASKTAPIYTSPARA